MKRTVRTKISDRSIAKYKSHTNVFQLTDEVSPLIFRYHQNREHGTFHLAKRINGQMLWRKLDVYPDVSTTTAHKMLMIALEQLSISNMQGISSLTRGQSMSSVNNVLTWYRDRLLHDQSLSPHTVKAGVTAINNHLIPKLGNVLIDDIDRSRLDTLLLWPLQQELKLSTVRQIFQVLKRSFKLAKNVGLISKNPLINHQFSEFISARIKPRATRLSNISLPKVLHQIKNESLANQLLVLLMLIYGTRIGETTSARWQDFDFKRNVWRIPTEHTKTHHAHQLPITPLVSSLLTSYRKTRVGNRRSTWLFPQKRDSKRPITAQYGSQIVLKVSKGQWSAHDLRKLARTMWGELGVDYVIGEILLNQKLKQLDQAYIQTYANEQCKKAIELWQNYLLQHGLSKLFAV
ncbi:tyrosine-type recombinase/integrase [Colwellia sp. MEBiC06753]